MIRVLNHNGLRLEYECFGDGAPLVFLHGMGGSISQITGTCGPIPGVRMIVPNQQGHGNSAAQWDTYDFDRLADDAAALLDELNIRRACFAGISMGAAVSLNFAVRFPERVEKLLLIRCAWTEEPMSPEVRTAYRDLGEALRLNSQETFLRSEGWAIVDRTSDYTRTTFTIPFSDPVALKNWQKYCILPEKTPIPSLDVLARLTMPVRILANRNDFCHPFAYGERMRDHIPGASLEEIPDKDTDPAGHRAAVERAVRSLFAPPEAADA